MSYNERFLNSCGRLPIAHWGRYSGGGNCYNHRLDGPRPRSTGACPPSGGRPGSTSEANPAAEKRAAQNVVDTCEVNPLGDSDGRGAGLQVRIQSNTPNRRGHLRVTATAPDGTGRWSKSFDLQPGTSPRYMTPLRLGGPAEGRCFVKLEWLSMDGQLLAEATPKLGQRLHSSSP